MYGLLYECKFLTIEETNKKKKKNLCRVSGVITARQRVQFHCSASSPKQQSVDRHVAPLEHIICTRPTHFVGLL